MEVRRGSGKAILGWLAACLLVQAAWAAIPSGDARAVNIAGLQRMLSQRIARSYLMIGLEIQTPQAQNELALSVQEVDRNLEELTRYATRKELKESLDRVSRSWAACREAVMEPPTPQSAVKVINSSEAMLAASEKLVQDIQQEAPVQPSRQVSLAGRQRMLSQRIAKLYLARHWRLPMEGMDAALDQAVDEYERGSTLLEADRINSPEINANLLKMRAQWRFARSALEQYKEGHDAPVVIIRTMDSILKQMDAITRQYVELEGR